MVVLAGVEDVKNDGGLVELIVEGKVNPEQLRAKVEEKTKTKVNLLSVSPASSTTGDERTAGCGKPGMVVLRTLLYCESCVRKCKKVVHSHEGKRTHVFASKILIPERDIDEWLIL